MLPSTGLFSGKVCTSCKSWFPLEQFVWLKKGYRGAWCHPCRCLKKRESYTPRRPQTRMPCPAGHKICSVCLVAKSFECFGPNKRSPSGISWHCKECKSAKDKADYEKHKEERIARNTIYRRANADRINQLSKRWIAANKQRSLDIRRAYRGRRKGNDGSYTSDEWQALCDRFGRKCVKCGSDGRLEADHVVPVSKGGSNDISNIQPLCRSCNARKWAKEIDYRTLHTG